MSIVPIVDLAPWAGADPAHRRHVAERFDDACARIGFVELQGHGIAPAAIEAVRTASDALFMLPDAQKAALRPSRPDINRGYAARGTESLAYSLGRSRPPDLFEAFNVGVDVPGGDPEFFPPNIWPEIAGFRAAVEAYLLELQRLARTIEDVIEAALDLPDDFFAARTDRSIDVLRINRYERLEDEPDPLPDQLRMGDHTDYGIFTILLADPVPGLQIVGPDGSWHDVTPTGGNVVVNLGDALAIWTNDRWRSTLHRVVPPRQTGPALRRSFAFFHDGNVDTAIECLPSCTGPGRPARYGPTTIRAHLADKVRSARTLTPATATQTTAGRLHAE